MPQYSIFRGTAQLEAGGLGALKHCFVFVVFENGREHAVDTGLKGVEGEGAKKI